MVGLAGPRDVEGGAVVNACAEERQADGYVHPVFEAHQLYGDVSLVVVLHYDHVELSLPGPGEDRIRRMGAAHIYALLDGLGDGGRDSLSVLVAEEAVLSRVGIESCDRYPRLVHPDLRERVARQVNYGQYPLLADPFYGLL